MGTPLALCRTIPGLTLHDDDQCTVSVDDVGELLYFGASRL